MADTQTLNWGDPGIGSDEPISEEDVKNAESMGRPMVGRYLCECVDSKPRQKDFANYSCIAANLKWRIERVVELNNQPVKGDEGDVFIGRFIFDDVALPHEKEKDGMRSRRILIAKRTRLIEKTDTQITKEMWSTGIIGKKAIINYIEEEYTPEGSEIPKRTKKVAFDGYEYAEAESISTTDLFEDI